MSRIIASVVSLSLLSVIALDVVAAPAPADEPRSVAVVIFDGAELLDFAGPANVLEVAGRFAAPGKGSSFRIYTVAGSADPVTSLDFMKLVPDYTPEDAPRPDVLIVPGGRIRAALDDEALMAWIDAAIPDALTLTVCTGAAIAAQLGHLDEKDATTFFGALPSIQGRYPKVAFHHGRRFIDAGNIITTAGVSAGIDGALHLAARLLGRQVAEDTARYLEYDWTPEPYLVSGYSHLNPSLDSSGRLRQQAGIWRREGANGLAEEAYRNLATENPEDAQLWYEYGKVLADQQNYEGAIAAHLKAASRSPELRAYARYNAACAAALSGQPERALDHLREAVKAGFTEFDYMFRDPDLAALRDDPKLRQALELLAMSEQEINSH